MYCELDSHPPNEGLTVKSIHRDSGRNIVVTWIDETGKERVIETCPPWSLRFYN